MRKTNLFGLLALAVAVLILIGARTTAGPQIVAPVVVGMSSHSYFDGSGSIIFRVWDDGMVEKNRQDSNACGGTWCGWVTVPE